MFNFDWRFVGVGVIVAAFGVLVAAKMPSRGADQPLEPAETVAEGINPGALTAIPRTNRLFEDVGMLGLEPDPASFDSAGLERWWSNYRQKHLTR
jgi:hypothetical protein